MSEQYRCRVRKDGLTERQNKEAKRRARRRELAKTPEGRERRRKWQEKNREKINAQARAQRNKDYGKTYRYYRNRQLKDYGMTWEDHEAMLKRQNGLCALCYQPPGLRSLHVDHDHGTGIVRGLLCARCNSILGQMARWPIAMPPKIVEYLERGRVKYSGGFSFGISPEHFKAMMEVR